MRIFIIFSFFWFYILSQPLFSYEELTKSNQSALFNKIEELKRIRFYKIERGRRKVTPLTLYEFTIAQKLIVTQDYLIEQLNLTLLNAKNRFHSTDSLLEKAFNKELINTYNISDRINEVDNFIALDRIINSSLIKLTIIPLKFQLITKLLNDVRRIHKSEIDISDYINYEFDITSFDELQTNLTDYIKKLAKKEYELLKLVKEKVSEEKIISQKDFIAYTIRTNKGLIIIYATEDKIERIKLMIEGLSAPYLEHEKLSTRLKEEKDIYDIEEFYLKEEDLEKYDIKIMKIREAEILDYIPLIEGLKMNEAEELLNFFSFKVINKNIGLENKEELMSIIKEELNMNEKVVILNDTNGEEMIIIGRRGTSKMQSVKCRMQNAEWKMQNGNKKDGRNVLIPVEIRDTILKQGVTFVLYTKYGEKKEVTLPKRKVIIPATFYYVIKGLGEPGSGGGKDGALIIQVHPKMTQDFRVDIEDTPDYDIVADVEYQDVVKTKIKDLLNKTGKQDIDTQLFIKTSKKNIWCINTENLLETYNPRIIDVERDQNISKRLRIKARIDSIKGKKEVNLGMNLIYRKSNKEFEFGNITKKVDDNYHLQLKFYEKNCELVTRLENFSFPKSDDYELPSLLIKKIGAQLIFKKLPYGLNLKIGNLKIPRVDGDIEEDKVTDELNFLLQQEFQFGKLYPLPYKLTWNLDTRIGVIGIGNNGWLRTRLILNLNYGLSKQLQFEINDDFIKLFGSETHSPWQNRRLTFIQYRKFVDDKTILGKLNLSYAFLEILSKREDFSIPFYKGARYRIGFGYELNLLRYELPTEGYIEIDYEGKTYYRFLISLREWM